MQVRQYIQSSGPYIVYGTPKASLRDQQRTRRLSYLRTSPHSIGVDHLAEEALEGAIEPIRLSAPPEPQLSERMRLKVYSDLLWVKTIQPEQKSEDFCQRYVSIFCGQVPEWNLIGFQVQPGEITLSYQCQSPHTPNDHYLQFLSISEPEWLHLQFELTRTSYGARPTYNVYLQSPDIASPDGQPPASTLIREDLGFMRRDVEFIRELPPETGKFSQVQDPQYLTPVIECIGL